MPGTRKARYLAEVSTPATPSSAQAAREPGTAAQENQAQRRSPCAVNDLAITRLAAAVALAVAALVLVVAVLPAEYGIDPTGVGRALDQRDQRLQDGETDRAASIIEQQEGKRRYDRLIGNAHGPERFSGAGPYVGSQVGKCLNKRGHGIGADLARDPQHRRCARRDRDVVVEPDRNGFNQCGDRSRQDRRREREQPRRRRAHRRPGPARERHGGGGTEHDEADGR